MPVIYNSDEFILDCIKLIVLCSYVCPMRKGIFLKLLIILSCNKDEVDEVQFFSGKLVKQGICMNYVIQVNDIDFPQDMIEKKWTDEFSEIGYENVFALESVCDFPESIKEGSSFRFKIDADKKNLCAVCLAFTPVPEKSVSITVLEN
jgi:hypothetical protein